MTRLTSTALSCRSDRDATIRTMNERVADGIEADPPTGIRTVGLIGGTGPLGRGLAGRLAAAGFRVRIGSRDVASAHACAEVIGLRATGVSNGDACDSDLVFITVPWSAHDDTLSDLRTSLAGQLVVDCVNPLGFDERGPFALRVEAGSAAQRAQELLPDSTIVAAFHHVSAELLLTPDALDADVLVVGDDRKSVDTVMTLINAIAGLRGVFAGRLRNAGQVEALTANLIAINRRYGVQSGVRVTGLMPPSADAY